MTMTVQKEVNFTIKGQDIELDRTIIDRLGEPLIHLLSQFEKIPAGNPLVQIAGDIRRIYGLEMPDAIIAASAHTISGVVYTRNLKDFKKVREVKVRKPY